MYSLGYYLGSSSIKCSILDIERGVTVSQDFYPREEMRIESPNSGWAEQDPNMWWEYIIILTKKLI